MGRNGDLFTGTYKYQLDERGRFNIPAPLRRQYRTGSPYKGFVVTLGLTGCLVLFPEESFSEYVEEFDSREMTPEEENSFYRSFLPNAVHLQLDSQGRVLIPSELAGKLVLRKRLSLQVLGNGLRYGVVLSLLSMR
jgi:MraZ protein